MKNGNGKRRSVDGFAFFMFVRGVLDLLSWDGDNGVKLDTESKDWKVFFLSLLEREGCCGPVMGFQKSLWSNNVNRRLALFRTVFLGIGFQEMRCW
jgi:hypothetical protein